MEDAKQLWSMWQRNLLAFRDAFTAPGWVRFAQWVSGTVLCDEEHTITQELTSLRLQDRWRVWEHFAEYGAWDVAAVERTLMGLVEREHRCRFGRYRPAAVDDTKELRASLKAWGVCTFKHVSRNAKHPKLVLAHNWVVLGELCPGQEQPWTYLPEASRLYLRRAQLPVGEKFRNKHELAVELLKELDEGSPAAVLGIFDGGYARAGVVRPCLSGSGRGRRIEFVTRPRSDARLYAPLPVTPGPRRPKRRVGRPRIWGKRLPSPRQYHQWQTPWQRGQALVYGRRRRFRCRVMECRWRISGPEVPVRVLAFEVEGYAKPWFIVTSALDLTVGQVLEAYAARFRQEDGIRDHKQRMGMEQVRAWTRSPVLRTFCVQIVALTLLRLLGRQLQRRRGVNWCPPPPWNPRKRRVSILDLRRLLWRHREEFSHFLQELEEVRKVERPAA